MDIEEDPQCDWRRARNQFKQFCLRSGAQLIESSIRLEIFQFPIGSSERSPGILGKIQVKESVLNVLFIKQLQKDDLKRGQSSLMDIINLKNKKNTQNSVYFLNSDDTLHLKWCTDRKSSPINNIGQKNEHQFPKFLSKLFQDFSALLSQLRGGQLKQKKQPSKAQGLQRNESIKNLGYIKDYLEASRQSNGQRKYGIKDVSLNPVVIKEEKEGDKEKEKNKKIRNYFQQIIEKTQGLKEESEDQFPEFLLRKIQLNQTTLKVDKSWAKEGGFGSLSKILAEYVVSLMSIHSGANKMLEECPSQKRFGNLIIKSKKSSSGKNNPYHQFELKVLTALRKKICPSIANYFIEEIEETGQPQKFFVCYYPLELTSLSSQLKSKQVLKIFKQILIGLIFLKRCKVIHRDLKPNNIMLTERHVPKIIDFGSAYVYRQDFPSDQIPPQLATSIDYNLTYRNAALQVKTKMDQQEFETHPLFDMYSFSQLLNKYLTYEVKKELGMTISMSLSWLKAACGEQDPNLRLTPKEAYCFLHHTIVSIP